MADEQEQPFAFTDLSDRLAGPDGAAVAGEALARLRALRVRIGERAEAGAPPEQYEQLGLMDAALASAERIVSSLAQSGGPKSA